MKRFDIATNILVFIGAINWGMIGLFEINLVHFFLENVWADRLVYSLVGFAAIYRLVYWKSIRMRWKETA